MEVTEAPSSEVASSSAPEASTIEQSVSREAPSTESQSAPQQEQSTGKPEGFDPVDVNTASPEQIKARIDRLYYNTKKYENSYNEQRNLNEALVQEFQKLQQQQSQIVNHLQVSDFADAESRLNSDRDAAWQKGDVKAFNEAIDKLTEIKVKKALVETQRQTVRQPQPVQQQRQAPSNQPQISSEEQNIAQAWMSETDASGNLRRPWTEPYDPRNALAIQHGEIVFKDPLFANKPIAEKFREIDRRMGVQTQQTNGQSVLGAGNLTRGTKTNNMASIKLDPKIEDIAVRTKFAGKDPKFTAQDHINAWKKAAVKSKEGARR